MTDDTKAKRPPEPGAQQGEQTSEHIPGRSLAGASYGADEAEQTRDVRGENTPRQADIAMGGVDPAIDDGME